MVEQQVQVVVHAVDRNPLLTLEEGKADAKFQDERFHFAEDGGLQVLLGVGVLEAEEVQQVRIAENEVRGQLILVAQFPKFLLGELRRLAGKGGAFEQHRVDLLAQRPCAPSFDAAHLRIEVAFQRIIEGNQHREVRPTQLSQQCCDNLSIRINLTKCPDLVIIDDPESARLGPQRRPNGPPRRTIEADLAGHFEQEATEETEKRASAALPAPLTHSKLAPGRISLDIPSLSLRTLKLMINPSGMSSSFM